MTTAAERRFAGYLLAGFTDLMCGTRYDSPCTECHCEDCLPEMPTRGCCGLGRALQEAARIHARRSSSPRAARARR